jgi:hypothetical protein
MSSTKEVYEFLQDAHGIKPAICRHCMNRDVEVWQDNWESCYECWCTDRDPKIEVK